MYHVTQGLSHQTTMSLAKALAWFAMAEVPTLDITGPGLRSTTPRLWEDDKLLAEKC